MELTCIDVNMADTSYVGLHRFCKMSKQIPPSAYTFGWNIFDTKRTVGGLLGYSSVNSIVSLNVPSSKGVSWGPKITAFHIIILLSVGAPETPVGGSSWSLQRGSELMCEVVMATFVAVYVSGSWHRRIPLHGRLSLLPRDSACYWFNFKGKWLRQEVNETGDACRTSNIQTSRSADERTSWVIDLFKRNVFTLNFCLAQSFEKQISFPLRHRQFVNKTKQKTVTLSTNTGTSDERFDEVIDLWKTKSRADEKLFFPLFFLFLFEFFLLSATADCWPCKLCSGTLLYFVLLIKSTGTVSC